MDPAERDSWAVELLPRRPSLSAGDLYLWSKVRYCPGISQTVLKQRTTTFTLSKPCLSKEQCLVLLSLISPLETAVPVQFGTSHVGCGEPRFVGSVHQNMECWCLKNPCYGMLSGPAGCSRVHARRVGEKERLLRRPRPRGSPGETRMVYVLPRRGLVLANPVAKFRPPQDPLKHAGPPSSHAPQAQICLLAGHVSQGC